MARHWNNPLVLISALALALTSLGWCGAGSAAAGELDKLDTALKLIPEDAAVYSSMLRNREQFDAVRQSKAWAKIQAMPSVQMGLAMYNMQLAAPGSGPARFEAIMRNPEIRKNIDLAADMVSDEIFVYGDDSCTDFVELTQNVNIAMNYGPLVMQATDQAEGRNPAHLQAAAAIAALAQHTDLFAVPNFVVGFKLKNTDLAKEQLIKLETIGNIWLESNEQTKGHFKKTKVGDHEYLVLDLDGSMIPWDDVPMDKLKEFEVHDGDVQKVIDRLKESKLVIAIGLRNNYLLVSVGSSLECLERLGKGSRLIDRPEFKPLEKYVDKRLTSIGYISEDMNQQINSQRKNIDSLLDMVDKLLPSAKLTDEQNGRIRKDAAALSGDVKGLFPKVGPRMGLSFLSERGIENCLYAWGDPGRIDGAKPLSLLQHVGGNPLLAAVVRVKVGPNDYDLLVKWIKTGYGYFEEFALPNMPEPRREQAKKFLAAAMPLFERMDKVNREMRVPALADGQLGLVFDGKLSSKHFVESLPATEKPMPMLEPALMRSVSDAKLLKQSMSEYRAIINGLIDAARAVEDSNIPENFQIPAPQVTQGKSGTIYSFPLPKEWGVDEKIVPNIGLSDEVVVLSASKDHTERLLKATPTTAGGVLEKSDRPLAAAVWLDWAALVEAATPWVDFGVAQAMTAKSATEDQQKMVVEQVHTGLDVLKTLRCVTSETYLEDEMLVTHTLMEIRDVEK